jgi:hypothetical protein
MKITDILGGVAIDDIIDVAPDETLVVELTIKKVKNDGDVSS